MAVDRLFEDFVDDSLVSKYYNEFSDDFEFEIETDNLPDALFGLPENTPINLEPLKGKVLQIIHSIPENRPKASNILDGLKYEYSNVPLIYFLELYLLDDVLSIEYQEKLKQYTQLFPDSPLLKVLSLIQLSIDNEKRGDNLPLIPLKLLFPDRESLFFVEIQQYLIYAVFNLTSGNEYSKLLAFQQVLDDSDFPDELTSMITHTIISREINVIRASLL